MLMSKAGAELQINITAVAENWLAARNLLANQNNEGICAAVLKADSYGLGADKISPALYQAGCRDFFVAYLSEGVKLRQILGKEPRIFAIHGNFAGEEKYFDEYDIVPVDSFVKERENFISCLSDIFVGLNKNITIQIFAFSAVLIYD